MLIQMSQTCLLCFTMSDIFLSPLIHSGKPICSLFQNDLAMLTRTKTGKLKPNIFVSHSESELTSAKKALTKPGWAQAIQTKFNTLKVNGTWTLITLRPH